tara:strand:- start:233 stop:889 length:657 start_codon:yes stop_codon:yes gene_type:complete
MDFDGFYITAKGGVSKSTDTGKTNYYGNTGIRNSFHDEGLGTGTAFGVSVGKYITNNFRLELEAIKRDSYEYDAQDTVMPSIKVDADIESKAFFINGFYDFQPLSIGNRPITPYLGGGMGISRNKMGTKKTFMNGLLSEHTNAGKTISQFAYKVSTGILFSLTEKLFLDINYQYAQLGEFKSGTKTYLAGTVNNSDQKGTNGGKIKSHELMVGLQYKF